MDKIKREIKIINEITREIKTFETMTSVAIFFNVHRRSIGRWIRKGNY